VPNKDSSYILRRPCLEPLLSAQTPTRKIVWLHLLRPQPLLTWFPGRDFSPNLWFGGKSQWAGIKQPHAVSVSCRQKVPAQGRDGAVGPM